MAGINRVLLDADLVQPEASSTVLERVLEARERQRHRLRSTPWTTNGEVAGPYLRKQLPLPDDLTVLNSALQRGTISARGVDKVLKLAWTLADMGGADRITDREIRVALQLRQGDQERAA